MQQNTKWCTRCNFVQKAWIFDFCKNLIYTPLCASMFSIKNEKLMKNKTIYCFLKVNSVIRWNKKYRYHVSGACCRVCSDDNLLGGQFKKLWDVVQHREDDDGNQERLARIDSSEMAIKQEINFNSSNFTNFNITS